MGRKRERRCNLNLEEQEIEREEQTSEWSNQPGGAHHCWWICSKKDYCRGQMAALLHKDFWVGRPKDLVATQKWAHPQPIICLPQVKTPSSHFIPPWRARLFTSENSPINLFCNFIFSHLGEDSYGLRWSEKRMKSLGTSPPPILIPSPLFQNPTAGDHGGPAYMGRV